MIQIQRLSHVTHAVLDREAAKELYQRILGARVFYEGILGPNQRDATLLVLNDLVIELTAPVGPEGWDAYAQKHGGRFYSFTLKVADLAEARDHLLGHGIRVVGQRPHHFVIGPSDTCGLVIEFIDVDLPTDPGLRHGPGGEAQGGPDLLGVDGLWSVSLLVSDVPKAKAFFSRVLGAEQVGARLGGEHAKASVFFGIGNARVSIMVPRDEGSDLSRVLKTQGPGIHGVILVTEDPFAAARYLRSQGLGLLGQPGNRLTTHPRGFMGARYLFMRRPASDDPRYFWREAGPVSQ